MDKTSKTILAAIALGLLANALTPLLRPPAARAAEPLQRWTCSGKLTANQWGGNNPSIGGYNVDVDCH